MTFLALCAISCEKILANELKKLGFHAVVAGAGRVSFDGDEKAIYAANLCSRLADRVYLQVARFPADNFDDLFEGTAKINWQDFFFKKTRIVVDKVRCHRSRLNSEHSVQKIVHKAIFDKLCRAWLMSSLPETGETATVRVYVEENWATLLLDTSGDPLYKRGWRKHGGDAPLRETVAASLLQMMIWRRKSPFYDPFCGSGTIAIEAMLFGCDVAPGLGRHFAFEDLKFFDEAAFSAVRSDAVQKIRTDCQIRIAASDKDQKAVESARIQAVSACSIANRELTKIGADGKVMPPQIFACDFRDANPDRINGLDGDVGTLVSNPPYGIRLGDAEAADEIYRELPTLFSRFAGWDFGILTPVNAFERLVGRDASAVHPLKDGNIENCFYEFRAKRRNEKK